MRPGQEHPEQLLWYVMGDLPPDEMRLTREHLRFCSACRDECAALVSTLRALQVEQSSGEMERAPDEADSPATASDAAAEGGARRPARPSLQLVPSPRTSRAPAGRTGGLLRRSAGPVLLAIAVLSLPAAWALWRPQPLARVIEPAHRVTLLPPVRGEAAGPTLEGPGPWLVRVVLPFGAQDGPYSLRIGTGKGTPGEMGETVTENADGALDVIVQPLESGRYVLTVDFDTRPPHDTFLYHFAVSSPPFRHDTQGARGR